MGLVERAMARLGYVKARDVGLPRHLRVVAEASRYAVTDYALYENQAKTYGLCSWVYMAVSRIAETGALVPFKVMRFSEGPGPEELQEVSNHPFEVLLRQPNDKMSQFELLEATFGHLELAGNAYWFLNLSNGVPVEIWPLRPDRVEIVPSPSEWVGGYVYHVNGEEVPLDRDEVVHFKRWHPLADYEGLSAIEAAAFAVEGDINSKRWNINFFKNNAVPGAIVGVKEHISDPDYDALVEQWAGKYKGVEEAHRAAFVRGSDITVTPLGLSHDDMQFLEQLKWGKDEIFLIFGIPLGKYVENATQANANVAERTFINETLWPKLCRVAQKVTAEVLPRYGDDLVGQFEDIRWVSDIARLEELKVVAQYGLMTTDEIRARYWQIGPISETANQRVGGVGQAVGAPQPIEERIGGNGHEPEREGLAR